MIRIIWHIHGGDGDIFMFCFREEDLDEVADLRLKFNKKS